MGRKAVEMGRYGASELMRNKKLQKKAVNYGISKLTPFIQDSVGTAMDQLSTKVRPKKKYKTDRKDLDGRGIDPMTVVKKAPDIAMKTTQELIPSLKPVYDRYKSGDIMKSAFGSEHGITSSKFWRRPTAAEEKAKGIIRKGGSPELFFAFDKDGKKFRQYKTKFFEKNAEALSYMHNIISSNPDTWPEVIRNKYGIIIDEHFWENNPLVSFGGAFDIHKAILKVAPYRGITVPGHNYTGPGNPLHDQLRYDDEGNILEIYQQPTGPTDAVSMQHDVDYTICGNKPKNEQVKCKNEADRKMVKSLDAIPWKKRQWGHALARIMINTKQKLGLGLNARRR